MSAILIRLWQVMEIVLTFITIFLQDDDDLAERALDGLRQVMMVKSYVVLPYLIPQVKIHLHMIVKFKMASCIKLLLFLTKKKILSLIIFKTFYLFIGILDGLILTW